MVYNLWQTRQHRHCFNILRCFLLRWCEFIPFDKENALIKKEGIGFPKSHRKALLQLYQFVILKNDVMVSMYRLDFSSMSIISVFCYFIACLLLISQFNPAYAHPVWITSPTSSSLEGIEPPVGAVRFDKRSLASGRWGLRYVYLCVLYFYRIKF